MFLANIRIRKVFSHFENLGTDYNVLQLRKLLFKFSQPRCQQNKQTKNVLLRWSSWEESTASPALESSASAETNGQVLVDDKNLSPVVVNAVIAEVKKIGQERAKEVNIDSSQRKI